MGINRSFGKSKAKAALARTNNVVSTPTEARLLALEATTMTALGNGVYYNGGLGAKVRTETSNYPVTTGDSVILGDATGGNIIITLPIPSGSWDSGNGASMVYNISKIDSSANTVTIAPFASETIGGDATFPLEYQNEVLTLITDGTNWYLKD